MIGVDVGGTNTDAVCLRGIDVVASRKVPTTEKVTSGLKQALAEILRDVEDSLGNKPLALLSYGGQYRSALFGLDVYKHIYPIVS